MKLSAVVKCHLLDQELYDMTRESLETIAPYVDELILIDHASPIGKDWMIRQSDIYIRNRTALGFPYTVTQGMGVATGDLVAVLNNDIKFQGDWVSPLVKMFEDDVALVHPKMLDWGVPFVEGSTVKELYNPREGLFFSAFILAPKVYADLGGWDTDYDFWGYDDWDYLYRVSNSKYKVIWTDRVSYQHKGGATISKIGRDKYKEKNRRIFEDKHGIDPEEVVWK